MLLRLLRDAESTEKVACQSLIDGEDEFTYKPEKAIVFVNQKRASDMVAMELAQRGFNVISLNAPEEIRELGSRMDNFLDHMRTYMPMETVKQKGHMFFRHGLEFTREWGNLTWFTEQAIESTHAAYARQARRYKMVDNRRQIFMLKYWFSQCLLEASRPRPDDAEEYEFWNDPAFFYDDATDE
ncbi:hypothetical protein DdX_05123 [Ditylenchus destructor]|uniref:Uncharacterized protein n=1 Tax=Ditylenchus destructor TaxID=166010 RepID=A0AAD4NDS6_9BILA|nr:hypothetical protein DdX_05123 [Ditylenchus destructor]